jgi:hypothetical protein
MNKQGISGSIKAQGMASFLPIVIRDDIIVIGWNDFKREGTDNLLLGFTSQILNIFYDIEKTIIHGSNITLSEDYGQQKLSELAMWGRKAYQLTFNKDCKESIAGRMLMMGDETPIPTFISKSVPFPWELLYDDANVKRAKIDSFWGICYSLARILTPEKGIHQHEQVQTRPSDMLFCLHHQLNRAHSEEFPVIERLVMETPRDHFMLLGPICISGDFGGDQLLKYIESSTHNMVHFACHCRQGPADSDSLVVSLLENITDNNPKIIELNTYDFLEDQVFRRRPLVFLNACQAAGGPDEIRKTFNLPLVFIRGGAAAVVATACPVPDLFASAFASCFYNYFLQDKLTIGQALQKARLYFWDKHHNPLGLAYGLYSPAFYQVAQPPLDVGQNDER